MTIDFNHESGYVPGRAGPVTLSLSERINALIDAELMRVRSLEPPRDYLGASILGDPCGRRIAYAHAELEPTPIDGCSSRIFATGKVLEDLLIQWIEGAGFDLRTINPLTGEQFAFSDGPIAGHIDGIIFGGPDLGFPYPCLWEAKGLNDRAWSDLVKHGLRASKPVYYGQVVLYMGYLDFAVCLFSALNKNTSEIYHELVPADSVEAQRLVDRAVSIVKGWMPPRVSAEPGYLCTLCEYRDHCWR
jgi:hypothetical protein